MPEKIQSLLRERESKLADLFRARMYQSVPDNPDAIPVIRNTPDNEILEAMCHCEYCGIEVISVPSMRSILLEFDNPQSTATAIYSQLAEHVNNCEVRKIERGPEVVVPKERIQSASAGVVITVYYCCVIAGAILLLISGVGFLIREQPLLSIPIIVWAVCAFDRVIHHRIIQRHFHAPKKS